MIFTRKYSSKNNWRAVHRKGIFVAALLLLVFGTACIFTHEATAASANSEEFVTDKIRSINIRLSALESATNTISLYMRSHLLADIFRDVGSLNLPSRTNVNWELLRRDKLDLFLTAINKLELLNDPKYNSNEVAFLNVDRPYLISGIDPKHITNTMLRQECERIKVNNEVNERIKYHEYLERLGKEMCRTTCSFIVGSYYTNIMAAEITLDTITERHSSKRPNSEIDEINTLLEKRISNNDRRRQIRKKLLERR